MPRSPPSSSTFETANLCSKLCSPVLLLNVLNKNLRPGRPGFKRFQALPKYWAAFSSPAGRVRPSKPGPQSGPQSGAQILHNLEHTIWTTIFMPRSPPSSSTFETANLCSKLCSPVLLLNVLNKKLRPGFAVSLPFGRAVAQSWNTIWTRPTLKP